MHAKLQKPACACTVSRMQIQASKHTWHTRDERHKLALGLPNYMYGVATGTVAVGNELQLFCN